jgi:hypothetical protein
VYICTLKFIAEFAYDKYAGGSGVCIIAGLCLLENYANIQGGLQVFLPRKKGKMILKPFFSVIPVLESSVKRRK